MLYILSGCEGKARYLDRCGIVRSSSPRESGVRIARENNLEQIMGMLRSTDSPVVWVVKGLDRWMAWDKNVVVDQWGIPVRWG